MRNGRKSMGNNMPVYNNVGQSFRLVISNLQTHVHIHLMYLKIWFPSYIKLITMHKCMLIINSIKLRF